MATARARAAALMVALIALGLGSALALWTSGGSEAPRDGLAVAPGVPVTIAVAADIGSDEQATATLAAMGRADADVHLALGDLSYAGAGSEPAWCDLVRRELGADVPVQVVAGNHEEDTGEDGRIAQFEQCLPDRMGSTGTYGREYFFDIGRLARVILVSPDLTIDEQHYYYGEGNAHERWLSEAIDGARATGIRWVVVGMHKNCLSVGEYYCDVYQDLLDLLVDKRVDLVLHGHEHSYQRSKQLSTASPDCPQVVVDQYDADCVADDGADGVYGRGGGPVFVVSGVGGGELYDIDPQDPEAGYFATSMGRNRDGRFGFTRLELSEEALRAEFVPSSPGDYEDAFIIE